MIAVAMSGGVDSSAAAVLLKESGEEIVGLSMQLWRNNGRCCSLDDLWDARRVATQLGIPYYVLNLEKDFENTVVALERSGATLRRDLPFTLVKIHRSRLVEAS